MTFPTFLFTGLLLLCMITADAQLCQGSLGDPIVNITFGAGANPGAALPGATTNYSYVSNDCPGDGFYTVRNNTNACFSSTWHTLANDHTGDANGYFMLVNSSVQPSAFYIDTVNLFCSNTTYEFAAWILNLSKPASGCGGNPIQPNLTFQIERLDGTIIQTYNTNNIGTATTPTWNQFGFLFQTPIGISRVVLRIVNNASGGCGNDLALDDITFRPCGPTITSGTGSGANNISFCAKDTSINMSASVSGYNNPFYQWQQSSTGGTSWTDIALANSLTYTQNFTSTTPVGSYSYRLTATETQNAAFQQCRVSSQVITVNVTSKPVVSVTINSPICAGSNLQFSASGGSIYSWTGPNGFTSSTNQNTIANAQQIHAGKYFVTIDNGQGCAVLDSIAAVIDPKPIAAVSMATVNVCKGKTVQLSASGGSSYKWFPTIGLSSSTINNPIASPTDSTNYFVEVKNTFGCADTVGVKVNVVPSPIVNAGPDKIIISGQAAILNGSIMNADSFYWSPALYISNPFSLTPSVNPPNDTSYYLHAISSIGCGEAMDTVFVKVFQKLVVPNAFSPNGDGINDIWHLPALASYPNHEVAIYDRYGRQLLRSNKFISWNGMHNGKPLPIATYYYVIHLQADMPPVSGSIVLLK